MSNMVSALALSNPQQANPAVMQAAQEAQAASQSKNVAAVKKTAKNFEAMYVQEMLQHMWEGVSTDGPMGGGHGEEVWRSLMVDQYGKMVSDSGQTKISDTIAKSMLRLQEQQAHPRGLLGKSAGVNLSVEAQKVLATKGEQADE